VSDHPTNALSEAQRQWPKLTREEVERWQEEIRANRSVIDSDQLYRICEDWLTLLTEHDRLRAELDDRTWEYRYREAVERAERAEAALAQRWQPIETAPKDGTRVLLSGEDDWLSRVVIGEWQDDLWVFLGYASAHSKRRTVVLSQPKFWQPLPAAPPASGEEQP